MAPPRLLTQLRGAVSNTLNRSSSAEQNSSEAPTSPLGDGMRSASSGLSALSGGATPPSSCELPPDAVPSLAGAAAVRGRTAAHSVRTHKKPAEHMGPGVLPHKKRLQGRGNPQKDSWVFSSVLPMSCVSMSTAEGGQSFGADPALR